MVARTLVKLGHMSFPKIHTKLPGSSIESLKHEYSVLPVHVFTIGGGIVATLYCIKLALYPDTTFHKSKEFQDVTPDKKIPFFFTEEVVADLTAQVIEVEKRPQVKEGQTFEN